MPVAIRQRPDGESITAADTARRSDAARDAIASAAIEGVRVEDDTRVLLERFSSGAIGEDELMEEGLRMYGRGA